MRADTISRSKKQTVPAWQLLKSSLIDQVQGMLGGILLKFNVADPALDREGIAQDLFLILQIFFLLCGERQ